MNNPTLQAEWFQLHPVSSQEPGEISEQDSHGSSVESGLSVAEPRGRVMRQRVV